MKTTTILYIIALVNFCYSCTNSNSTKNADSGSLVNTDSLSHSIQFDSQVGPIFQDSKGNYWFCSKNDGLYKYNGQTMQYIAAKEGLHPAQIRSIKEDRKGNIWLGTDRNPLMYDGNTFSEQKPIEAEIFENTWSLSHEDLWFNAGNRAGVYRYDGNQLKYLKLPKGPHTNPNNVFHVTDISKEDNRNLWIATYAGAFGYNGVSFTMINDHTLGTMNQNLMPTQRNNSVHIRSILLDSKGRLWLGNNGIGVLLHQDGSTINFSEQQKLIHPNSKGSGDKSPAGTLEHVFAIEEDLEGNIWFGDRDTGLWKYDGQSMKNYTQTQGLDHNFVTSIYCDKKGRVWIGLENGTVSWVNNDRIESEF